MIDLKELVMKAARSGIQLYLYLDHRIPGVQDGEHPGYLVVRAVRAGYTLDCRINKYDFQGRMYEQGEAADRILDFIIEKMNTAAEEEIRTGGTTT